MNTRPLLSFSVCVFLLFSSPPPFARAQEDNPESSVSYYQQIRPIFQAKCQGCHQPAKQGGEYIMTDFAALLSGGETGSKAIVPGKPGDSYLMELITPEDGTADMPKNDKPLARPEIELVRKWIQEGAKNDTPKNTTTNYDMDHPPVYQTAPQITSVHHSPDGSLLAVSGYHEVLVLETKSWSLKHRLVGLSERIESSIFSPDGKQLAVAGGSPGRRGEIQIWNMEKKKLYLSKDVLYDTLYGASWSPDGKLVAFGCPDNTVRAINVDTGKQVLFNGTHNGWVMDTTFGLKAEHVVSVSRDMSVKLIEFKTQRFMDNITSITPGALKGGLYAIDRHPTKNEIACGGADGVPKIYQMIRNKKRVIGDDHNLIRKFGSLIGRVYDVKYNFDASQLVACSSLDGKGQLKAFNVADG
ncbi:MAG: c-type cytochrome domain-containing protein, partial [Planctomycetota bacterium]|nr:c-type cytochrome domain-containing protein [Planctomycetota bacterium]